jgi:RND family efflux transporter MFP subunit
MMKKILYIIITLAFIVLVVVRLKSNKEIAQSRIYTYDKEQAIKVGVDTIEYQPSMDQNFFTGIFEADKETKVSADIQGSVIQIYVDEGSYVKKGQTLIKLDDALLKLQLQSILIQIEGLEADVKRYSILAESDAIQGVQLEKSQLGLKSAHVQRNILLEQISKTVVVAPFNSIVTLKMTEVGSFAAPGVPLFQLTDISSIRFTIQVPEHDLNLFQINQVAKIQADANPNILLSGKTSLIGSKSTMANTYPVQFLLKNTADLKIKAGMFGKVMVSKSTDARQPMIPSSAIIGSFVKPQVYVVDNGKARLQNIEILRRVGGSAIIQSGLKEGDVIVTIGLINLFDGANVETN